MHLTSWESHPSEGLSEASSFAATVLSRSASGLDASIIISSACHGLRYGCAAPSEKNSCGLPVSRQQKEGKKCAVLFGFQGAREPKEKAPSLSMPKSQGGYNQKFLAFQKFFQFGSDFTDSFTDRLLGYAV